MADAVDRSALAPATLVGRREELSRFDRLLGETGSGAARVVEVAGDPGIGKTRLLVELAARAEMAGRVALYGRAAEFERHVPFGVVGAAIEDHLSGAGQARLAALHPDDVGLLRDVFRSLPGDAAPTQLIEAERYRLHRAVRALLESLAEPDGLVLILDDLHWADDGSGELLDHLLRRPPRGRILLALAHRPRQTRGRLRHALARAAQEGAAELIEVGPLSLADVRTLLPAGTTGREARQVYAASGGNPFYVQALVRAGARTTEPADSDGLPAADDAVPAHVWAALATELAALAPVETLVAQAAAVAGDGVEADLLAQTADLDLAEALAALDHLVRRDVVRPIRATGRFQFRHPLLRRAAYETAGAGWRVAAHTRAAAALRDRGAPASQQARHVERSARPGDPQAIAVLYEAATATMHSTPATAAHWLRAALPLLPDDPAAVPIRLALTGMLAKALGVVGRLEESRDVLQEILRLIPREPAEQRAKYVAFAALIERLLGRPAEARAILVDELSGLDDQDGPAALTLKVGLATGVVMRAERDAIRDWTAEALAAARRGPHRIILAGTLAMRVVGCHLTRTAGPTAAMLDEAAAIVDSLPDAAVAEGLDLVGWIGMAELCEERPDAAIRHFDRALRVARGTGQGHVVSYVHGLHGAAYAGIGDLATAAECFDNALDAAMLTGSRRLRGAALEHQCYLAVWRGDLDEALRLGKEAFACAPDGDVLGTSTASGVLALAHLHAGDPETCVDLIQASCGGPELLNVNPAMRADWYDILAAAEAGCGRTEQAAAWADRAEAWAAELPRRTGLARLARVHALLPVDPAGAVAHAREAVRLLTRSGDRVAAGRAHLYAGTTLAATGETDDARAQFGQARAVFEACGARLFLDQAVREERRMNARAPRRTRGNPPVDVAAGATGQPDALTARELQIARLVAEGMTNRQVGEALYLSPKTVGIHLSRVYAKLGVSRRAALAARLARHLPSDPG